MTDARASVSLPPMSAERAFLAVCGKALGEERVRPPEIAGTGALPRRVPGVIAANCREEVQNVVRLANAHGARLSPISTGKNWGFGGALPVQSGVFLLDLRGMNRIREINEEFGYAVVEPGVTQGDLAQALLERGARWTLDVTGAGPDTSIVGNTMERGIAYHSQRTHTTRALEVVLGDGSMITTGFQDERARTLNQLYSHGIGPDAAGLFYQSRFGVVTAMTIDLMPVPKSHASVSLNLNAHNLPALFQKMAELRRDGALEGVPHVANRARLFSTLAPLMVRRAVKPLTREQAEKMLAKVFPDEWNLLTSVHGPASLARAKVRLIRRALRPLGRLLVMTRLMRLLRRVAGWVSPTVKTVLAAAEAVEKLPLGTPTGDAQRFLDHDLPQGQSEDRPENHPRGFVYLVPLMPGDERTVRLFLRSLDGLAAAAGQTPAVTLNALDSRVVEAVVSLTFDKSEPVEVEKVLQAGKKWLADLRDLGAHPYRAHVDHMDQANTESGAWAALQEKLGSVLDPNGTLSPGRY